MKKLLFSLAFATLTTVATQAQSFHGEKITPTGAVTTDELVQKMANAETLPAKVTGTVESVCRMKGCWMKVRLPEGQTMRVTFKDYGFFVPKDIVGKTVVFEGTASRKTTSVDDLKHYAQDAGKSKEEIAKITQPEKALAFVAEGVIVK